MCMYCIPTHYVCLKPGNDNNNISEDASVSGRIVIIIILNNLWQKRNDL
jgi:hypothetical protein